MGKIPCPPHFHALHADDDALIDIGRLRGRLPPSRLKLVLAWTEIHRDELLVNWDRGRRGDSLIPVEPLR